MKIIKYKQPEIRIEKIKVNFYTTPLDNELALCACMGGACGGIQCGGETCQQVCNSIGYCSDQCV